MNSSDLLSLLSQRRDIIESFHSECQKDQDISIEIDMKLLNEAILCSNHLIDTIIDDVGSSIVPESFYEHLQHDIEKNLPNKFPMEFRRGESKLLSYKTIAEQIINIDKLCETYDFYKKLGFAQKNTVLVGANGCGKTSIAKFYGIFFSDRCKVQCKKGFFAHLKLYFGSAKKPFCVIYRVSDAMKTYKYKNVENSMIGYISIGSNRIKGGDWQSHPLREVVSPLPL